MLFGLTILPNRYMNIKHLTAFSLFSKLRERQIQEVLLFDISSATRPDISGCVVFIGGFMKNFAPMLGFGAF